MVLPDRVDATKSLIFAVGDIHGDIKALGKLIHKIHTFPMALNDSVVFTGNLIGEGTQSRGVLQYLKGYQKERRGTPQKVIILRGPNEHRMMKSKRGFMTSKEGRLILESYREPLQHEEKTGHRGSLNINRYSKDREWLLQLPAHYSTENLFFSPSGVDPAKELNKQNRGSLTFIKHPFYSSTKEFGKTIVHGNRPSDKVTVSKNRVNLDSSRGANLSCVVFNSKTGEVEEVITVERTKS